MLPDHVSQWRVLWAPKGSQPKDTLVLRHESEPMGFFRAIARARMESNKGNFRSGSNA